MLLCLTVPKCLNRCRLLAWWLASLPAAFTALSPGRAPSVVRRWSVLSGLPCETFFALCVLRSLHCGQAGLLRQLMSAGCFGDRTGTGTISTSSVSFRCRGEPGLEVGRT